MELIQSRALGDLAGVEWHASGDPAHRGEWTVRGHASVFNRLSHDLGGFRERIMPGAFDGVLDRMPDVHLLWDHQGTRVLARTKNKTLDLRADPIGLHFWGRSAPTSYAADLRILMDRGDVDQASFAFIPGEDEWHIDEEAGVAIRDIHVVSDLFDVTICAAGAYPQTDSVVAHKRVLDDAIRTGRLAMPEAMSDLVARHAGGKGEVSRTSLAALQRKARARVSVLSTHVAAEEAAAQ